MQPRNQEAEREALAVLDTSMAAFSAHDWAGTAATVNFPHVRIANGQVEVWNSAEEHVQAQSAWIGQTFEQGWEWSAWDEREPIQSSPDKVHLLVRYTRYAADGTLLATYPSLWIVTRQDGRWGVQARSSFAP